jgi:uncharacterized protein (DUF433 family)
MPEAHMDWSDCPDVERIPGKVSGRPIVKGTRILADAVVENAEAGFTPEEIAQDIYPGMTAGQARRIIAYARANAPSPA